MEVEVDRTSQHVFVNLRGEGLDDDGQGVLYEVLLRVLAGLGFDVADPATTDAKPAGWTVTVEGYP